MMCGRFVQTQFSLGKAEWEGGKLKPPSAIGLNTCSRHPIGEADFRSSSTAPTWAQSSLLVFGAVLQLHEELPTGEAWAEWPICTCQIPTQCSVESGQVRKHLGPTSAFTVSRHGRRAERSPTPVCLWRPRRQGRGTVRWRPQLAHSSLQFSRVIWLLEKQQ